MKTKRDTGLISIETYRKLSMLSRKVTWPMTGLYDVIVVTVQHADYVAYRLDCLCVCACQYVCVCLCPSAAVRVSLYMTMYVCVQRLHGGQSARVTNPSLTTDVTSSCQFVLLFLHLSVCLCICLSLSACLCTCFSL